MFEASPPAWAYPIAGFRSRKAAQMCAYFSVLSGGTIEKLKLIKLIYLSERKFLSKYHHPMLFDEMYSLPHGPICSNTLNGINGIIHDELWSKFIARNGNIVVAIKKFDRESCDEISDAELDVVSSTWDQFKDFTASQLRNYSHKNCPEYTETKNSRFPISYEHIFQALGKEHASEIAEDIRDMIAFEGMLAEQ